jgi:hypothetical protein
MVSSEDKKEPLKGEKGLSQLICFSPNYEWKLIKIAFLKEIRENPLNILGHGGILTELDKLVLEQQINIDIIAETVSFGELLGAYFLAFSKKEKILQKTLFEYKTWQVTELYKKVEQMNYNEISKLIGYPDIEEFELKSREKIKEDMKKSSENIKKTIIKIARFYLKNLQFYNDYKHGFRIFPTTSSPPDSKTFGATFQLVKGESFNKAIIYNDETLKKWAEEAFEISDKIRILLSIILPIFRERIIEDKKEIKFTLFNDIEDGKDNFEKPSEDN